jgi:uncharacterized UPF0160 family protein
VSKVATHNGVFHADEVTAIGLLQVFGYNPQVYRVPHQTKDFEGFNFIIDIGKEFDNVSRFDHHQYTGGKSSAGLIWDFIGQDYPEISKLVSLVDNHDTGVSKAGEFEYPSLVSAYNHSSNIYDIEQDEAFDKAVDFAATVIQSLKDAQDSLKYAEETVKSSEIINNVLVLKEFTPHWSKFVNGVSTPELGAVMWFDPQQNLWKAQVTPVAPGSFELHGKKFTPMEGMDFVHAAGFFAVANDGELMLQFLNR